MCMKVFFFLRVCLCTLHKPTETREGIRSLETTVVDSYELSVIWELALNPGPQEEQCFQSMSHLLRFF